MRILITGMCGFIGHHVTEHFLKETDWELVGLDRIDATSTLHRLRYIDHWPDYAKRVKFIWHDLKAPLNPTLSREIGQVDVVLHLAASTHVDRSIVDPISFVQDNVLGTARLLDWWRREQPGGFFVNFSTDEIFGPAAQGVYHKEFDPYNCTNPYSAAKAGAAELTRAFSNTYGLKAATTHCHDEQTRAFTPNGIRSVDKLRVGDLVWGIDIKGNLVRTEITEIVTDDYTGPMISISGNKVNQLVTPNHRVMISTPTGSPRRWSTWTYVEAAQLLGRPDRVKLPTTARWNGFSKTHIKTSELLDQDALHPLTKRLPTIIKMDTLMELFGWFISEGCTNSSSVLLAAGGEHQRSHFVELFERFGLHAKSHGRATHCSSKALKEMVKECGHLARNKQIPSWCLELGRHHLQILFDTLMAGDGSTTGTQACYYTTSKKLAEQVTELAIKLGHTARICERETWNPRKTVKSKSLIVRISKPHIQIDATNVHEVPYEGRIWCLRTGTGNFFIERNGCITCSGNTMNVFGERQHAEKFIPMVIRKICDGETVTIHADQTRTKSGSRFYIHAENVGRMLKWLIDCRNTFPQFDKWNIVGEREMSNLELAQKIAGVVRKPLRHEMVDFHSSRPGHDLRYALDGTKLAEAGFKYPLSFERSLERTVKWFLENPDWLLE